MRRGEETLCLSASGGDEAEEAVVEEAALEDEVAERVAEVPDEEEAQGSRGSLLERKTRSSVCDGDNGDSRGERDERRGVEQVGGEGGDRRGGRFRGEEVHCVCVSLFAA